MRFVPLFLTVCVAFSCGCAGLIGSAGKDLGELESKEQMHAFLGDPVARGVAEDQPYEEFRTRRVIAEDWSSKDEGYGMLLVSTCGAVELVAVPYQIYLLGKRTLLGQTVRVIYDQDGAILAVARDGESVLGLRGYCRRREPQPTGDPAPTPPTTSGSPE